jgi:hypothetical protein
MPKCVVPKPKKPATDRWNISETDKAKDKE